ncbi:xanthine dehydrogenase accessory factor [Desulfobaculum xiamenense]|uniref:Xanthine dehydrogenase accessory factor n=1 Tax=Desulfobaculum xiamenense TaxID=995050 RepID=A0A846QH62_9BACT|nr:XdhC/CoxI family protein [Desulfobaculum xiamenense]NJB66460.1 xanthine dehydrogenase accessory factor [Desulfobaculum xiamenense]
MKQLIRNIRQHLEAGEDLVIATIIDNSGSTPRTSGSKMLVFRDGCIDGSVGGGIVEAMVQRAAAELFTQGDCAAAFREFDLSNELAARSDMICGGRISVLLEHLPSSSWASAAYTALDDRLRHGQRAVLFTRIDKGDTSRISGRTVLSDSQPVPDWPELPADEATTLRNASLTAGKPVLSMRNGQCYMAESFLPLPSLYIFGAGHVSRPTASLAASVGFRTIVLDDRAEFACDERFPNADEIRVLPDFHDQFKQLGLGEDSFIVIVTRGHMHDKTVLAQALRTPARYVGMIGSIRKRDAIYDALRAEGFTQADIDRCHCPIGLSIGAQTPEEIAVSIISELIMKRAEARK